MYFFEQSRGYKTNEVNHALEEKVHCLCLVAGVLKHGLEAVQKRYKETVHFWLCTETTMIIGRSILMQIYNDEPFVNL